METADVIVIGSGQGGIPLAADFANEGRKVVLFERDALGGSCINYGCTPSKAFLAAAHTAGRANQGKKLGIHTEVEVDFPAVMERVREIRSSFNQGIRQRLESAGVKVICAEASFVGERTVKGGDVTLQAPLVIINTGTSSLIPDIPGLAGTPYLTNRNFFDLNTLPARLLVIGGGYIGLELGQGLARLGSQTHLIVRGDRVLGQEEADVSEVLAEALKQDGIGLHFGVNVNHVAHENNVFKLTLSSGEQLQGEALLVVIGRKPNTGALNAANSGIELDDKGFVKIDDQFHTTCSGVYAIGDAAKQPAFTHVSWEDYRRLKAILCGENRTRSDRVLGYAVYTEPQVGRVGMTLEQAQKQGINACAVTLPMSQIARAIEWGHDLGFYRMVIDSDTDKILGATLVGYETAELVHVFLSLIEAGATWQLLERSVHIHPTYGEALPSLARLLLGDNMPGCPNM
ncbi:FAD-dependent pyridine nucleotide-disulphide oxidoreductase [Trichormus variabilis ATCC 29413]|uniref:FAD-dependent pyridine nucleotide-disulphide oxidoreductase n=2 Tax=Anabaena variabilis TaxID=264691 RepID=Q3M7G9_TRIV2|nr:MULTISPECIES: FAD-dependent oxidoreductase [Nostocaceae]ABA23067.1 FAD-dependent pyridine nucleotide-disulphide oxidoreductase [Trichormus variabilis ATCC 29413]MBC1216065.1 FAD-dependent oxidoreductase [Trichormus variabilis ARAD]MBC1254083.1 FAD-dependent oxidoreductase [Trichormus variabilis V5]MBC1265689.1 FAD-dependent oxidoreductase [Trichormus variabilis FSR]MBC1303442.1 FAD-dependent oxidoreductase [Trichormus variabilis N2B]